MGPSERSTRNATATMVSNLLLSYVYLTGSEYYVCFSENQKGCNGPAAGDERLAGALALNHAIGDAIGTGCEALQSAPPRPNHAYIGHSLCYPNA